MDVESELILPDPERPSTAQLSGYGDLSFLYMRSQRHRDWPVHALRRIIQPPIDLRFFKVFRIEGVPRAAITWGFLGKDAEARFMDGKLLKPAEWRSGPQMWVIEIIAPYGQGTAAAAMRWLKRNVPDPVDTVRFLRAGSDQSVQRAIEARRIEGARWGARVLKR